MISLIDVSNNQGTIAWDAVAAAGYEGALIKATEGTTFRDGYLEANGSGAASVGLVRGYYHFARPDLGTDPRAEADWFLTTVGELEAGDLVMLDMEEGSGDLLGWALAWLDRVEGAVGFPPLFYSRVGFMRDRNLLGSDALARHPLHLAAYTRAEPAAMPMAPPAWDRVTIHQWTSNGSVPGVSGHCDLNHFDGTADELRAFGKPAEPKGDEMDDATKAAIARYLAEMVDLACGLRDDRCHEAIARAHLIAGAIGVDIQLPMEASSMNDPDTGTGQQLKDYLPFWDRSYEDIEADGPSEIEISAVKNALQNAGFVLKFPAHPDSGGHWRKWSPGDPI